MHLNQLAIRSILYENVIVMSEYNFYHKHRSQEQLEDDHRQEHLCSLEQKEFGTVTKGAVTLKTIQGNQSENVKWSEEQANIYITDP